MPAGPQVQGAACPRRVQSRVPNWKGGRGWESQGCRRDGQEAGPRENRTCVWRDWTRGGGQRKKQTEQGLGGNLDLGLQNPLQGIPGTLLHQEGPGPRAWTSEAKPARPHSPAHSDGGALLEEEDPPKLSFKSHSQVPSPHRASFLFACLSNPTASVQPKGSQPVRTGLGAPPHPANKMWESGHT